MSRSHAHPSFIYATVPLALVVAMTAGTIVLAQTTTTAPETETTAGTEASGPIEDLGPPRADLSEARALVLEKDFMGALAVLEELRPEHPDDPALLKLYGELLLQTGRPADAVAPLERAAEIDPDREGVFFQLGTARSMSNDREGAIEAFGEQLERTEETEVILLSRLNRALLFDRSGAFEDAASELEEALQFAPDRSEVYGNLSSLYIRMGRLDDAREVLERGANFGFRSADHYYSLGARHYLAESFEEAEKAFRAAIEIAGDHPKAERSLGATLEQLGREDEAVVHLRRYLELAPTAPDRDAIEAKIRSASEG